MAQDNENIPQEGLEKALSSMLSDPDSMSRLASMAQALASSGILSGLTGASDHGTDMPSEAASSENADTEEPEEDPNSTAIRAKPALPSLHGVSGRHTALLRAIRPYLGAEKQARVDRMVKLLQLAELADTVLRGS